MAASEQVSPARWYASLWNDSKLKIRMVPNGLTGAGGALTESVAISTQGWLRASPAKTVDRRWPS
jgi:hypothetical protein